MLPRSIQSSSVGRATLCKFVDSRSHFNTYKNMAIPWGKGGDFKFYTGSSQNSAWTRDLLHKKNIMDEALGREKLSLVEEQSINETGPCRAVEICVEDHPKMVSYGTLLWARHLGITAIEMGVQTTDDEIHRLTKRDSTREELIDRAMIAKEFGFKVLAHVMPDLPGSTPEKDKAMINDLLNGVETLRVADYRWVSRFCGIPIALVVVACVHSYYGPLIGDESEFLVRAKYCLLFVVAYALVKILADFVDAHFAHVDSFLFDFDRWKLYPCMVLEFSELKTWYENKTYIPYFESLGPESLYSVIEYFMQTVKPYQRVERIIRDIPASDAKGKVCYVVGGVNVTNAQQIVDERMVVKSLCLRTREINNHHTDVSKARMFEHRYYANRGEEYFLSFETPCRKFVYGFLKLRFNNGPGRDKQRKHLPSELHGAAIIRWLQVYGRALAIGGGNSRSSQHVGFGRRLMERAEAIAKSRGYKKIADISGVGVRQYYREKLGYHLEGTYMVKHLI